MPFPWKPGDALTSADLDAAFTARDAAINAEAQARASADSTLAASIPALATNPPVMDGVQATGVSARAAKEDHVHASDTSRAPVVHTHAASDITTGIIAPARLGTGTATSGTVLYGDGTYKAPPGATGGASVGTATPQPLAATALAGSAVAASREDHVHQLPYALLSTSTNPGTGTGSAVIGVAQLAARADHGHATDLSILATTGTPGANSGTGSLGVANLAARADHVHPNTAPALANTAGGVLSVSGIAGSAATVSRSDHSHPTTGLATLASGVVPLSQLDISAIAAAIAALNTTKPAESADGSSLTTTTGTLVDSYGTTYQLVATNGGQIQEKAFGASGFTTDPVTSNVNLVLLYGHSVYQRNTAGSWYVKARNGQVGGTGINNYNPSSDPRPVVNSPRPSGSVYRIADMTQLFGFNLYPSTTGVSQGSGDGSTDGIVACLQYIAPKLTGLSMSHRLYANDASPQAAFANAVCTAMPNTRFAITQDCGVLDPTETVLLAKLSQTSGSNFNLWVVEGQNEPNNTQFGNFSVSQVLGSVASKSGYLSLSSQIKGLNAGIKVAAPSIIQAGYPDATITSGYWGSSLSAMIAASDYGNFHNYSNSGNYTVDSTYRINGVSQEMGGLPVLQSEWDAILYQGNTANATYALQAYYTVLALVDGYVRYPLMASLMQWTLYGYYDDGGNYYAGDGNTTLHIGAFASSSKDPRHEANALRALFTLTTDTGSTLHSFAPTVLPYTTSTLNAGEYTALYQNSLGTYFLMVYRIGDTLDATVHNITITFTGAKPSKVEDFSLTWVNTSNVVADQTVTGPVSSITTALRTEVRMLRITM